jgi:hypothetical protein
MARDPKHRDLDDRIHRYSPRWIDTNGTLLPWHIRYSTYFTAIALLVIVTPGSWLLLYLPGIFGAGDTALIDFFIIVVLTVAIMSKAEGDLTVRGVLETYGNEARTQVAVAASAVQQHRAGRPIRYTLARIGGEES